MGHESCDFSIPLGSLTLEACHPFSLLISHVSLERQYGGDERIRTADPLLARQVLSQLSYTPI